MICFGCLLLILAARPHVYYIRPAAYIITMHCFNISQYVILNIILSKLYIYNVYYSDAHVQILTVNAERSLSYGGSEWAWFGHDDVTKWKHFPRYWPFVRGIPWSAVDSHHKGQWRGALMFSLICTSTKDWANNPYVGDLRRHGVHYDVTVMT